MALVMQTFDAIATPTMPIPAPRIGQQRWRYPDGREEAVQEAMIRFVAPFSVSGQPALSVPCGFTSPIRHIHAHLVALPRQFQLAPGADSVNHLKLESLGRNALRAHLIQRRGNHLVIVRRNGRVDALLAGFGAEHEPRQAYEIGIHIGFGGKCHAGRFVIRPFHQANTGCQRHQIADILLRAIQVRLQRHQHIEAFKGENE